MKCGSCFCRSKDASAAAPARDLVERERESKTSEPKAPVRSSVCSSGQVKAPESELGGGLEVNKAASKFPAVIVNQYEISEVLGEGAQAIVCLAKDNHNRPWAIKVFEKKRLLLRRRGKQSSESGLDRAGGQVTREIAIMKKLDHPNIVRLHEILDSPVDNKIYMVIEHVDGGPVMDDKEEQEPLSEEKARDIFRQLVKGLEYLHYHGIIHRDIKPSNLLLTRTGLLKISDFGISAICEPADDAVETEGDAGVKWPRLASTHGECSPNSSSLVAPVSLAREKVEGPHRKVTQKMSECSSSDGGGESVGSPLPKLTLSVQSTFCTAPPYVTPRTLDAAKHLDPASEEYKRIHGNLYPPTPSGIDAVKHNDLMSAQIGTFAFFPPERCVGTRYKGKLADVWAAGVTLYIFLQGTLPFQGATHEELSGNIQRQKLEFRSSKLSAEAKALLRKMLQKRASDRLSIQAIKRSLWVRRGGGKFGLSPGEANSIDVTPEDLDCAVTEVDLSIGITPMVRSKSWTATPENLRAIRQLNRELNQTETSPEPFEALELPQEALNLTLDTLALADDSRARPLSVPARQLRKERLNALTETTAPNLKVTEQPKPMPSDTTLEIQ